MILSCVIVSVLGASVWVASLVIALGAAGALIRMRRYALVASEYKANRQRAIRAKARLSDNIRDAKSGT